MSPSREKKTEVQGKSAAGKYHKIRQRSWKNIVKFASPSWANIVKFQPVAEEKWEIFQSDLEKQSLLSSVCSQEQTGKFSHRIKLLYLSIHLEKKKYEIHRSVSRKNRDICQLAVEKKRNAGKQPWILSVCRKKKLWNLLIDSRKYHDTCQSVLRVDRCFTKKHFQKMIFRKQEPPAHNINNIA